MARAEPGILKKNYRGVVTVAKPQTKVGFEKLADLNERISQAEARARELWGSRPGTVESDLLQKTMKRIKDLQSERDKLRDVLHQRGEPDYDPVEAVRQKYAARDLHNRRIDLLKKMCNLLTVLNDAYIDLQIIERPTMPRTPDGVPLHLDPIFVNFKWNLEQQLVRLTPMTQEGFNTELKAAEELFERLRAKAEAHEKATKEIAAI